MKVYCPACQGEVTQRKMFGMMKPMECPDCKRELEFKANTASYVPLFLGTIIFIMVLHSFHLISDDVYGICLVTGFVIGMVALLKSKVIAQEVKK
ncbi:MAG: hypothetical protein COB42_05280 [Sulfurimonas sp.]|nr:MAG: hypothetical protein COB42_05280 [Sulfurimonas sp.]